jgi:hypothetical protein
VTQYLRYTPKSSTSPWLSNRGQKHHEARRGYSGAQAIDTDILQTSTAVSTDVVLSSGDVSDSRDPSRVLGSDRAAKPSNGSRRRKRQRLSRPASVLQSLRASAQEIYVKSFLGKVDLSHTSPRRFKAGKVRLRKTILSNGGESEAPFAQPVSLYSILARYLDHQSELSRPDSKHTFSALEQSLLQHKGFAPTSVASWATCLSEPNSLAAVAIFEYGKEKPPLFVLLLVLRRRHMSTFALGVISRHINERVKSEPLPWHTIKLVSIRLLRHARKLWPELIPWIAALFAGEASALFGDRLRILTPRMMSDVTSFSNTFLLLLSLPSSITPILGARNQEQAQFRVLQFMASRTPAITVTKLGFRSISRTQLAQPKTTAEREWAELKGPSWPPWKEDRTAMDEDKSYEFGASRAAKILHRMYEAGYRGHTWEEMTEVYAGWDTDFSPTIQTRTSLPHVSSHSRDKEYLTSLLWAGRVRTTRTRREAWAAFLAYELSGAHASEVVYLAMFEKLHYSAMERSSKNRSQTTLDEDLKPDEELDAVEVELLPGDMKEVLTDPSSPLHYVYLSEPIPTVKELYERMYRQAVRPSNRLLAFLLEAAPTFKTCIDLLEAAAENFNGGIGLLLYGQQPEDNTADAVPGYVIAALIKSLCRFGRLGRFIRTPQCKPLFTSPERHARELRNNSYYLMEYAHALLYQYRPLYRPAWTAYLSKVARSYTDTVIRSDGKHALQSSSMTKYDLVWNLVECMEQIDLDVDDDIFQILCTTTTFAAQAVTSGTASHRDARQVLSTGSSRLRKSFHSLVGANMDMLHPIASTSHDESNVIPPHIPGPATLRAYVRALGSLHDYEGLYSFSTWLTKHHVEVTARAKAQNSGNKWLFRTLVALRAAVTGCFEEGNDGQNRASDKIVQLIRSQIEGIEEWGGWPGQHDVDLYIQRVLKSETPRVGGR